MKKTLNLLAVDIQAAACVLLLYTFVLLSLKNPTSLDDGLRHFAMAAALKDAGLFEVSGWDTFFHGGYMHTTPVDPWFLYDVLLVPFTYFSVAKGLQLFIVAQIACLLASFLLVLRSLKIDAITRTIFLLVLVFGDVQFMGRFLLGRPYALMTSMLLLVLWSILERRWVWLSIFLTVSALLSQLFIFPLMLCFSALIAYAIVGSFRMASKIFTASVLGVFIGVFLHPYPIQYISYLATVFLRIPFLKSIGLSREMHAGITDASFLSVLIIIMLGLLLAVRLFKNKAISFPLSDARLLFVSIAIVPFFFAFIFWVRAIDVLWPIILVWLACLHSYDPSAPRELLRSLLPYTIRGNVVLLSTFRVLCIAMVLVVPFMLFRDDDSHDVSQFEVLDVIPSGSRVLNLDWQLFSVFAVLRPDLSYATGIDRSFTHLTNPEASEGIHALEDLSAEDIRIPESLELLDYISMQFPSDYLVLSHKKFNALIQVILKSGKFQPVVDSSTLAIFQLQSDAKYINH
jgi:hypothetical protein